MTQVQPGAARPATGAPAAPATDNGLRAARRHWPTPTDAVADPRLPGRRAAEAAVADLVLRKVSR